MTFAQLNLNPEISKALTVCGYKNPTPVQAKSIPEILQGYDVIACAQTGTGKTAAFVLPALQKISEKKSNKPRVLILTPTRELATQITQAATQYGKFMQFNIVSLVGGMPYRQQLRSLSRSVDIVVATPGRLLDHMENRKLDLSEIEMLILDEADRMLDMGFIDDVRDIAKATPNSRQTLLFSATVDSRLMQVIKQIQKDPVRIDLSHEKNTPAQISQELYMADNQLHKSRLLLHFLQEKNVFKAIIFTATKINADVLAGELSEQGFEAAALHGDLKQNQRNKTVERLRRGKIQFLVATDVAARGIDIDDITHVFNYDLPKFSEDYIHRIGRTGRAGKTGIAISFASSKDLIHVSRIERLMKQGLERKIIPGLEPRSSGKQDKKSSQRFDDRDNFRHGKKKSGDRDSFKKSAAREGFKARTEKKFKDRDGFKARGDKKFSDRDSEFKPRGEKNFGDRDNFKPRGEKKFGDRDRGSFKPRGEKKFGDRDGEFKSRGEKKFADRDGDFKPRREKQFGDRDGGFKPRGEKKFGDRSSFKSRGEKKFGDRDSEFKPRRERKFGDRDTEFKPRGERKFGGRDGDSKPRGEKRFASKDGFKPRGRKPGESKKSFGSKEGRFGQRPAKAKRRSD